MSKNILIISDTMLKERTSMHGNTDAKLVYPDIKYAQDAYIAPILGSALYDKLLNLISADTIGAAENLNYKTLLDEYIVDALIWYTMSEASTPISFQFWNKGVVRKQGENTELPSMSEIVDILSKHKTRAEHYAQRLKLYLMQNATAKFPEYINPGSGIDTIIPSQRAFTLPIYLGPDENPYCNPGGFTREPYHD